jgi:oligosaccharyltransferase complex subunit beta
MRWLFSFLLLALLGVVSAKSIAGSRLLVVLEDAAEKEKYGVFLGDLEGMLLSSLRRCCGTC